MRLSKLEITNFKGIQRADIEIDTVSPGNVITLIGLNESGKTTVLEAISHFVSVDTDTSSIVNTVAPKQRPIDLIPKAKKSNFTGEIKIRAFLTLDKNDIDELEGELAKKLGVVLVKEECPDNISVTRSYPFEDSDAKKRVNYWTFKFKFRKRTGTKHHIADGDPENREVWDVATDYLATIFPKIVYFPTFLFSVPDKIYLEDIPGLAKDSEQAILNNYFRQVLQDVADSLNDGVSIQKHIVDRISRKRSEYASPLLFLAALMGLDESSQIKAVVNRLAGAITRTVFDAWNEIFDHKISGKSVQVDWGVDAEKDNIPFLQLGIFDGEHTYSIHERSLGFRWFFTFLLFTQFRKSRSNQRGTIFLFDEPASNLHASAQSKLLESFGRTAQDDQFIVYSTHSHYMIDPLRLEKAFIVENRGIDFEGEEAGTRFESKPTDIRLTRYRQFVAKYPKRVSYFQPALDALKFSFDPLSPGKKAVVVEGKFDYHPLSYFQSRLGISDDIRVFPAPSASEAGTLISLLRGLGTTFVVMLDDDKPGRDAVKRYKKEHLLTDDEVFTLAAADASLSGKSFEALYGQEVDDLAASGGKPTKGQYSMLFQRLSVEENYDVDLGETLEGVKRVWEGLRKAIG